MKDEFKKLNTYCALGEDGNIVDSIESDDINDWKTNYISGFNRSAKMVKKIEAEKK